MADCAKGTLTPLAEVIPIPDLNRAIQHMKEAIDSHANHLQELHKFLDDNIALSKLLHTLPESVRHKVMVPFGKLAFFPGSLIHTNELLVLLGGGYYSERSAKQTIDIMERRNQYLESKITNVKSQISDLQAEIEFALNTAAEAADGVVEIREDYYEPSSQSSNMMSYLTATAAPVPLSQSKLTDEKSETTTKQSILVKDEEHERLMARLSEIEMAETAANAKGDSKENDWGFVTAKILDKVGNEDEEDEADDMIEDLEHETVDMEQYDVKSPEESEMLNMEEHDTKSTEEELEVPRSFRENMLVTGRDTENRLSSAGDIREHEHQKPCHQASMRLASSMDVGHASIDETPLVRSPADFLEFEQCKRQQLDQENLVEGKLVGEDGAPQYFCDVKGENNYCFKNKQHKKVSFVQDKELSTVDDSTAFQKQAFSGTVIERVDAPSAALNFKSNITPTSTVSRFRKRQGGA